MRWLALGLSLLLFLSSANAADLANADKLLASIRAVSKEGTGNQEAGAAWKELVSLGGDVLFPTLKAFDDATPLAANWLRSAINAIGEKEKAAGRKLPADKLEAFLKDTKHAPGGRRIAYEFLVELDPKTPDRLLPGMLNDASFENRRDAVAAALKKAEKLEGAEAKKEYTRLFDAVRDKGQADALAELLKKAGESPSLTSHFGVLTNWMLVGPFDSTMGTGYNKAYEPEKKVDLAAKYVGKANAELKWIPHTSTDPNGLVNLNKAIEKHKDSVAYAFTLVDSPKDMAVEIRFGCISAVKVFLNGKELFQNEEYHHGERFDQYLAVGTLKAGKNELLVKVCQNNQTEQWAQNWQFQLRLCDATGGALPVKSVLPAK
ncbi:MAG: hypothetical protein EXS09_00395 [Gemmataceae bacterium]|nr:hypothetical protein [Gemmataceae bacterium]